jgi:hypothetical protein
MMGAITIKPQIWYTQRTLMRVYKLASKNCKRAVPLYYLYVGYALLFQIFVQQTSMWCNDKWCRFLQIIPSFFFGPFLLLIYKKMASNPYSIILWVIVLSYKIISFHCICFIIIFWSIPLKGFLKRRDHEHFFKHLILASFTPQLCCFHTSPNLLLSVS